MGRNCTARPPGRRMESGSSTLPTTRRASREILNVESGQTRPLTRDAQVYLDPVFSPDGSRLAYVSTKSNGNLNLAARPIHNGDWSGQAVALTRDHDFGRQRSYFSNWDIHIEPA